MPYNNCSILQFHSNFSQRLSSNPFACKNTNIITIKLIVSFRFKQKKKNKSSQIIGKNTITKKDKNLTLPHNSTLYYSHNEKIRKNQSIN